MEKWQLEQRQKLSLNVKINLSLIKIRKFYQEYNGEVYISYSGGKDSEVMLHLIKSFFPDVKVLFVDTGTELHTRDHALKKANIVLKPKKSMLEVWNKYGIPFPTKQQAHFIYQAKHTKSDYLRSRLITGIMKDGSKTMFKISNKWKDIITSDIEVSDMCCHYLKKEPIKRFNKKSGMKGFIATMASDGQQRKKQYLQNGCIDWEKGQCTPLGFWTEQDILEYIKQYDLDYCDAYGEIIKVEGKWETTKAKRTGCVGCGFGVHLEKEPNRFQRMKIENPKLHNTILNVWCDGNMGKLLKYHNVKTK